MKRQTWLIAALSALGGVALGLAANRYLAAPRTETPAADSGPVAAAGYGSTPLANRLIQEQAVLEEPIRESVRINGRMALNAMRLNQIASRLAGRVDKIMVFEGASVRVGEPVALLYSPEFISAQNEFLLARNTARMLSGTATADLLEDAKVTLASARNKLKVQGASDDDVRQLEQSGIVQQHLVIRSPIAGRFIKRNIDPGSYLDTGASLGTVADLSTLWFLGNAFEADLPRLREGLPADIVLAGMPPGQPLRGRISFIAPTVDPQTHTVTVRVDVPNADGRLKPDMFARADIALQQRSLPVVPRAAVVQDGAESFVMVRHDDGRYERVSVDVAPGNDEAHLAVTRGLRAGDRVVTEGSVLVERSVTHPQATPADQHGVGR